MTPTPRSVSFLRGALGHLRWLPVYERRQVTEGIRQHLVENDPLQESRNKFALRRGSEVADYELRIGSLRVLYRVEGSTVWIAVVGRKERNRLIVMGEEFEL